MQRLQFYRRRSDDKKTLQQLLLSVVGIISLLFLFFVVGIPILLNISGFIAGFKKETPQQVESDSNFIFTPYLDPLPDATPSANISVTGSGKEGSSIRLFLNGARIDEKIIGKEGTFKFSSVPLENGKNEIYVTANLNNKDSQPSSTQTIYYINKPPKLEIESPTDGSTYKRDKKEAIIKGRTDSSSTVTVNDRYVFVNPNGSFDTTYQLTEGENNLEIKAMDSAGNTTSKTIKVIYEK